jgi:hypothetical protein
MIQTIVREYKKADEYQRDVALQTSLGWQVADVTNQQHGRSGKAKGAMVGATLLTGGLLAPAAIFAFTSGKSKLIVTYTRGSEDVPELPVIPEGLGWWQKQQWFHQNEPDGIGIGKEYQEWKRAVEKHTKEVRGSK